MIHLDRNHLPLESPHTKSNLILPTTHNDQHDLLWSSLPHDDNQFFVPDSTSPLDTHPASPQEDKSSSLSPAPEDPPSPLPDTTNSPPPVSQSPPPPPSHPEKEPEEDRFSRQLTPLTELSPAPDDIGEFDAKEEDDDDDDKSNEAGPNQPLCATSSLVENGDMEQRSDPAESEVSSPKALSPNGVLPNIQPSTSGVSQDQLSQSDPKLLPNSHHTTSAGPSQSSGTSSGEPVASSSHSFVPSSSSTDTLASSNPKVVRILELNNELLKVCMEFQARGLPMTDQRFQQYAQRLQSNLTWLAAAADLRAGNNILALPSMDPPPHISLPSADRIQHLYSDLHTLFAKDIARRQLAIETNNGSPVQPAAMPNGNLKRDRPDDHLSDPMNKRRDTGDNKSMPMQPPTIPSISIAAASRNSSTNPMANGNNHGGMAVPPGASASRPGGISPPMAPPSTTPTLPPFAMNDAQAAAMNRDRMRQMQIQQAREEQQRKQRQMQQLGHGTRQMSPSIPSAQPQPMQGNSSVANHPPPQNANSALGPAALAALGPNAAQNIQMLQNPSHPFMQYMNQAMPGFLSLPMPQQMQKMQMVQAAMQARSQQGQASQQRNANQGSSMSNGNLLGGHHPNQGQTPTSPLTHQSPLISQPGYSQSLQNGMFPHDNQSQNNNPGMDHRAAASNFTPQVQNVNMNNLTPQQRHYLIVQQQQQQQQQMRNTSNAPNPATMVNQQQAYAMTQRMTQASSPHHTGSPMSGPGGDTFPALRSNSTIPGIARSTRSPSETMPSPMTPRAPSRLSQQSMPGDDYQRAMMQHAAQASLMSQNTTFNPQMQGNVNASWQQGQQMNSQGNSAGYGMSPPSSGHGATSFGGGSAPSPSGQGWQQGSSNNGGYDFVSSPGHHPSSQAHTPRHLSATPGPQSISPSAENPGASEYDIFNWGGQ